MIEPTVDREQLRVLRRLREEGLDPEVLYVSPLVIIDQEEGEQ